ncbi:MAG: hypothetical protein H0V44_14970, partial [Planctomycetes bacterium]|nr:hypothetical protein [Planctomycetota bacterium]
MKPLARSAVRSTAPSSASCDDTPWLENALAAAARARVTVFGDLCLDAYWHLADGEAERSVETGLPVQRVERQVFSLGGAANVAANARDLGAEHVRVVGVVGDDGFGLHLRRLLERRDIDGSGIVAAGEEFQTLVYAKPYRAEHEQPRIDFGGRLTPDLVDRLLAAVDLAAGDSSAVILNQQVAAGLEGPDVAARLAAIVARHPRTVFLVDARAGSIPASGVVLKLNVREAARLVDGDRAAEAPSLAESLRHARVLTARTAAPVVITRGERGMLVADGQDVHELPGILAHGAVDPVGAGDTVAAALAA